MNYFSDGDADHDITINDVLRILSFNGSLTSEDIAIAARSRIEAVAPILRHLSKAKR